MARRWFCCAVTDSEKASLLRSQFDSKRCREQFVIPLSCFPHSRCNSLAFRTPVLLRLLRDLDTYGGVNHLVVFPLFLKIVADIISQKFSIIFVGQSVWDRFRSDGGPLM